jgi:hypothetical protein
LVAHFVHVGLTDSRTTVVKLSGIFGRFSLRRFGTLRHDIAMRNHKVGAT